MRFLGRIVAVFGASICPRCRGSHLYFSRRKSDLEKVLGAFSIRPLRCRDCNHRFWKLAASRKRASALSSTPASFNPVIAVFAAAMVGFTLIIYAFPTLAMCGFAGSAVGIINELYAGRRTRVSHRAQFTVRLSAADSCSLKYHRRCRRLF